VNHVYLVLGKRGLLGNAFVSKLSENTPYRVFSFDHSQLDISNKTHVGPVMKYVNPTVVINCAAVNDAEVCEDARAGAFTVNSVGPEILAAECRKIGAKLIHFSSVNVFDGKRTTAYTERCRANPINVHGESKLEGERAIAKTWSDHLIIRPGWVFHYEGDNFVTDWVSRGDMGLNIPVREGKSGSPTYLPDLVEATIELIKADAKGVYHLCNGGAATWERLAETVVSLTKSRSKITTCGKGLKSEKHQSPKHGILSARKYNIKTGKKLRPWGDALKHCLSEMHRLRPE
jgi:dTDP-4-dehydrorhamnose reductase